VPYKPPTHRPRRFGPADTRGSAGDRGYDYTWQRFRAWYAARVPAICAGKLADGSLCGRPGPSPEMHLDHILPLDQGGARLDPDNVQWLCQACHNRKTMKENRPVP
jgi:5-methylcytosine-specific restriction protein A